MAYELKYNQLKEILDTYTKRLLRLNILQHSKRVMPVSGVGLSSGNFELDSD